MPFITNVFCIVQRKPEATASNPGPNEHAFRARQRILQVNGQKEFFSSDPKAARLKGVSKCPHSQKEFHPR